VIFDCELKVREHNGDGCCDDKKDAEDNKEHGKDGEVLVPPDAGEDVVQFDVDGTEGQKAGNSHLWEGASVPGQHWDFSRILSRAARRIKGDLHLISNT
jgi:hypothetical protein